MVCERQTYAGHVASYYSNLLIHFGIHSHKGWPVIGVYYCVTLASLPV